MADMQELFDEGPEEEVPEPEYPIIEWEGITIRLLNVHHSLWGDKLWEAGKIMSKIIKDHQFGVDVAIDPTFAPMTSDWNIIPLTLINKEQKIVSGGIVFASSLKATIFKWILRLLVDVLPCKDQILTLCSDDDTGLEGSFNLARDDQSPENADICRRINGLNRVICFWHKSVNFSRFIHRLGLDTETQERCRSLFREIGLCRNRKYVDECIEKLRGIHRNIDEYLKAHVDPKLEFISKAYMGPRFNCGYITSSVSESSNHQLKAFVQTRSLTLAEMRDAATELYAQRQVESMYVKGRKPHKCLNAKVMDIMTDLNVSVRIAESIAGSSEKANRLHCKKNGPVFTVVEEVKCGDGTVRHDRYNVTGRGCPCCKREQSGIPCSHIIAMLNKQKLPLTKKHIASRWILDSHTLSVNDLSVSRAEGDYRTKTDVVTSGEVLSVNGRFVIILSQAQSLANAGSKDAKTFDRVMEMLKQIESEILYPHVPTVVDDKCARPGRKAAKRKGPK